MIESLSTAIEFRSGESGEHIRKIHDITKLFLENSPLGRDFSTEEIEHISLAAIMHDVGKISIPDAILSKPGRLTPEEFEIMKTHTTQGGQLLERIPQMRELPFSRMPTILPNTIMRDGTDADTRRGARATISLYGHR